MIEPPQDFSGVIRIDRGGETVLAKAYGFAHRGHGVANTVDTRFAIASGTKGLTAVTVLSLIADGSLSLSTTARSVLGDDLPLIAADVTVEHLLANRSGIGDYYDEDAEEEPVFNVALLDTTESFVPILDGYPTKFAAGTDFSYCNGGFVVLALIAERVSGVPFHDLVRERVCVPAGMHDTEFLRSDEPLGRMATGYVSETRSNLFDLPVRGNGDGGIYTTVADFHAFWQALFAGKLIPDVPEVMRRRTPETKHGGAGYALGFWRHRDDVVMLQGGDPGVSFRSVHDPVRGITHTVVSNVFEGAWPPARQLEAEFATGP
ncbi:serine hydrolase domain-containing protein [Amycolatopsis sp. NPDC059657]|uniref:serine hydrolase domain-containing protein n=1 Tax=Amycolatopsis sp. NPDC059657 TaxID=3346899 RepID=UPI003672E234